MRVAAVHYARDIVRFARNLAPHNGVCVLCNDDYSLYIYIYVNMGVGFETKTGAAPNTHRLRDIFSQLCTRAGWQYMVRSN